MVNILLFPGFRKAQQAAGLDEIAAPTADDAAMMAGWQGGTSVLKLATPAEPSGDWTNQELADLYRVEALLAQAGMRLETDRGMTDEDEPWFVFCNADGDVFVHLARLDGRYVLDSPGLAAPVHGDDFNALVNLFVQHQQETQPSGNVVRFRHGAGKNGAVQLHPAMMLAALILTLYLASDGFLGTAQAAEADDQAAAAPNQLGDIFDAGTPPESESGADPEASEDALAVAGDRSRAEIAAKFAADARQGTGPCAISHIAASLSAVALSFGLFESHVDPALELAALPELTPDRPQGEDAAPTFLTGDDAGDLHLAAHAHDGLAKEAAIREAAAKEQAFEQLDHMVVRASALADVPIAIDAKVAAFDDAQATQLLTGWDAGIETVPDDAIAVAAASSHDAQIDPAPSEVQSLLSLAGTYTGDAKTYTIGTVGITASFDVASLDKEAAELVFSHFSVLPPSAADLVNGEKGLLADAGGALATLAGERPYMPSHITAYDKSAKDFVLKFLQDSADVEMIMIDNAILFVDITAIDEASDVSAVRSWALDDTTTVSMIGHADYFDALGYLA